MRSEYKVDDFKVDEKVEVIWDASNHKGQTGVVVGVRSSSVRVKFSEEDTLCFMPYKLAKVKSKGGVPNTNQEYTFKVKHEEMVLSEEIKVSREYPIAIVSIEGSGTIVSFHKSIGLKADQLGLSTPPCVQTNERNGAIFCATGEEVGTAIVALKSILKAPWKTKGKKVTVKMLGAG